MNFDEIEGLSEEDILDYFEDTLEIYNGDRLGNCCQCLRDSYFRCFYQISSSWDACVAQCNDRYVLMGAHAHYAGTCVYVGRYWTDGNSFCR